MKPMVFDQFLDLLEKFNEHGISYQLSHVREDTVMMSVAVPGERWEIELWRDGNVEIERFISIGAIEDKCALEELFARYSDAEADDAEVVNAKMALA